MKKYEVFDTGRPALGSTIEMSPDLGWNQNIFDTFEEAVEYVKNWLGPLYDDKISNIVPNIPIDYSGCGDTIEIRLKDN